MKLGTLLLRNAAIGLSQLEAALRNQVLYGGRLGTNLVELGFIDLELLSTYLAELSGYPIATPTLLEQIDPALADRLGGDAAHRLRAIPLGPMGNSDAVAVAVAMVEPGDAAALEELGSRLGARITPYVVPELRAMYYLEKHFGQPRRARFIRSARPGTQSEAAPEAAPERRRSQPARGMVMPPAFTLEPRRRRASTAPPPARRPLETTLSLADACAQIDAAGHREQVGDAVLGYARGRFDALVVFLVRDGNALGWRGYSSQPAQPAFAELSLPLGGASSLQAAHDTGVAFVGTPPSAARPVETKLWAALAADPPPPGVAVVPVLVKQRAVNLIYAHVGDRTPSADEVRQLGELAARMQDAYLRLIRNARGS